MVEYILHVAIREKHAQLKTMQIATPRLCRVCRLSRGVERVELEWSEYVGVLNKWACAPH